MLAARCIAGYVLSFVITGQIADGRRVLGWENHPETERKESSRHALSGLYDQVAKVSNGWEKDEDLFWALTTSDGLRASDGFQPEQFRTGGFPHMVLGHPRNRSELRSERSPQIVLGQLVDDLEVRPEKLVVQSTDHPANLELYMSTIGGYPVFHTPVAVGEPAQPFKAWLNPHLNGLYVRSSTCSKRDCGRGFTYDATKSTTRSSLERRFEVEPRGWRVGGNVSTDTLHLGSVDIKGAMVGEIDKYEGEELFFFVMEFVVDGALGIARPNHTARAYRPLSAPNPLFDLIRSRAVAHNALTLTLPRNTEERGAIQVGLPRQPVKGITRLPFGNQSSPGLAHSWHVVLDSVSLVGHPDLHIPLKSVFGRIDLEPSIGLPREVAKRVYETIGAKPNKLWRGGVIDCEARKSLPDLVLNVGGHKVALARDEYSSEQHVYGYAVCVVAIVPTAEEDVAVLGTNFLNKFHTVIDIDEHELGLIDRED